MSKAPPEGPAPEAETVLVGGLDETEFGSRARSLALIFGAGFSTALGVFETTFVTSVGEFANANAQNLKPRLAALLVAGVVGAMATAAAWAWSRNVRRVSAPTESLVSLARACAPLLLTSLLPPLFAPEIWKDREQWHLLLVGGVGLLLERLLTNSTQVLAPWTRLRWEASAVWVQKSSRWVPSALLVAAVAYYWLYVGHLTVVSHEKMGTMSSDLAEFDNLFFNALHGHPFRSPAIEGELANWSALKVHAEFGLYFLLPFYALRPGPEALLWIQAGLVAVTAIPVFLMARARLGGWAGVVFAGAFLLMPAVERPNFYDFHFTPLGMVFVVWLLFFLQELAFGRASRLNRFGAIVAFGLALISREDVSIGLAILGVFLVLRGVLVRWGLTIVVCSIAYFGVMKFAIMPHFGTMWFDTIYQDLKAPGAKGFGAVVLTLLSNPTFVVRSLLTEAKLLYFLHMAVPLMALWLRRPLLILALFTGFVSTLLVTNRPPMFQSSFQYTYLWVPYVVAASILAVRRDTRRWGTLAALAFSALAVGYQHGILLGGKHILGGFVDKTFEVSQAEREQLASLRQLIARIPPDASVAATEAEGPHVSTRLVMYSLKFTLGHDPDYLLVGGVRVGGERAHLAEALDSGKYGVIAEKGPFLLVQRGADPANNGRLRRRLGRR